MCSLEKFAVGGALCVGDHDWDDSMGKAQRQGLGNLVNFLTVPV